MLEVLQENLLIKGGQLLQGPQICEQLLENNGHNPSTTAPHTVDPHLVAVLHTEGGMEEVLLLTVEVEAYLAIPDESPPLERQI